jgi:hypothetical protein
MTCEPKFGKREIKEVRRNDDRDLEKYLKQQNEAGGT